MRVLHGILALSLVGPPAWSSAQRTALGGEGQATAPHRTRLILKDGSYQVVMSYKVVGNRVRLISAERGGASEEIPLALVDLEATRQWESQHAPSQAGIGRGRPGPVLDPELLKEEADRAALAPEVAPDLRLAPEDTVLALDTYRGTPELVPLQQSDSDLNKQTGHNILKAVINPLAATHQLVQLKGEKSAVQMHVNEPAIYVRLDDEQPASGEALTVETHGAADTQAKKRKAGVHSEYVIVRVEVRQDARVVASFNTSVLGSTRRAEDVMDTEATELPGGHWLKIVPKQPLLIGEYALVEVLNERELNLGVWDFGIHPTAPENREAIKGEKRGLGALERRGRN